MVVTGITIEDNLNEDADVLTVDFDDGTHAYMFYKYSDAMKFLNKDVIVSFREDLYKGNIVSVVNTFTECSQVHTLESDDNIKLYSEDRDNHSNVVFADLEDGCFQMNAIMYCVDQRLDSSPRATWMELTVRDSRFKLKKMRLFDYDNSKANFKGRYVKCDIRKNQYGLVTQAIIPDDTIAAETPETAICRDYAMKYFAGRDDINTMLDKLTFWEKTSEHVNHITGGDLISLAYELRLLNTYKDILPGLMYEAIDLALLLTHMNSIRDNDDVSPELRGIIVGSNHLVNLRMQAFKIIDGCSNDTLCQEKKVYKMIKQQAADMMELRYD